MRLMGVLFRCFEEGSNWSALPNDSTEAIAKQIWSSCRANIVQLAFIFEESI